MRLGTENTKGTEMATQLELDEASCSIVIMQLEIANWYCIEKKKIGENDILWHL